MEQTKRCGWVNEQSALYCAYHDEEWGTPLRDDGPMYELFLLELFQAGLSWITLLKKREAFRAAFDGFDVEKIAAYGEEKVLSLLQDASIIRSRGKIEAAISNAKIVLSLRREFGSFCNYLWSFSDGKVVLSPDGKARATSPLSDRMAADMKRRGMRYAGSVTIHSFLQAAGIVNEHDPSCGRYAALYAEAGDDGVLRE
ncbi:MAG: DNA-3-methyladenine glycosylase I [Clostridiales bacterium]|nr:DNA-3-methyladenine glycosylase I [Clostridiales bacterium]